MMEPTGSPIAQVDPRFALWRKVRVPIFLVIGIVLLAILGALIYSCSVARDIEDRLDRADILSRLDTEAGHDEALAILTELRGEHPDHEAIRVRLAWQHALVALRLGPAEEHSQAAREAIGAEGGGAQTALEAATRAALQLLGGEAAAAEAAASAAAQQAPSCQECSFVHAMALVAQGRGADAVAVFDRARQGTPPFLPALAALAEVLRDLRRFPEAANALNLLGQAEPDHEGAQLQAVLLQLDQTDGAPAEQAKLLAPLSKRMAGIKVADGHPRLAAYKSYADGRLALAAGDHAKASGPLSAAAKVLTKDPALARWRAVALRGEGRLGEAVDAMTAFPDAATTDLGLMLTRAEILVDLHRTEAASAPLALLLQKNIKGAALLEGRRRLFSGEPRRALEPLKAAVAQGDAEAILDIAEAHLARGRANEAHVTIRGAELSGSLQQCAEGYRSYLRGASIPARSHFVKAVEAGGRCGASLAGRLLVGTGQDQMLNEMLQKALADHEDVRDRVALARLKLRVEGGEAAKTDLDAVRALEPEGAVALRELAEAYDELGLREEAAAVATDGVTRTKGHPLVASLAARYAREAGRVGDAERLVAESLKVRPSSALLHLEKMANHFARKQWPAAEEQGEQAVAPGPVYADAACLLSKVLTRRGNARDGQNEILRAARRAASLSGGSEAAEARACVVEFFIGRGRASYGKARGNIRNLRTSRTVWAKTPVLVGILAEQEGKAEDAAAAYRRAIELDPAFREAWDRLAGLGVLTAEERARFSKIWPGQQPSAQ